MKILHVLVLLFFLTSLAKAQADGSIFLKILLKNSKGQTIKNAEIETFDKDFKNKRFPFDGPISYLEKDQSYSGYLSLGFAAYGVGFRISADGFETFERVLDLPFGLHGYSIILKARNSNEFSKITKLTAIEGSISDSSGKGVPNVKITVLQKGNEVFNSVTNSTGFYWFYLPKGKYDLKFSAESFNPRFVKDFIVPSSENKATSKEKKMNLTLKTGETVRRVNTTNN